MKRFECKDTAAGARMKRDDDGYWVSWDDHQTEVAKLEADWDTTHKKAVAMVDNLRARVEVTEAAFRELELINAGINHTAFRLTVERDRYRTALDRVWDALTAEDKRGAFTDTLWMPDNTNTTVFEFIDHTLNPA